MKPIELSLHVNYKEYNLSVAPNKRLLDILREDLGFTGVKEGCSIGECGACTVLMNGKKVNSCMILAGQAQHAEILTIEGLKGKNNSLHPIQQAFIDAGSVQCGYCIPGMVLSSKALLDYNRKPTEQEIKEAISGNLCRCTGYKQIINAVKLAAKRMNRT